MKLKYGTNLDHKRHWLLTRPTAQNDGVTTPATLSLPLVLLSSRQQLSGRAVSAVSEFNVLSTLSCLHQLDMNCILLQDSLYLVSSSRPSSGGAVVQDVLYRGQGGMGPSLGIQDTVGVLGIKGRIGK